MAFDGKVSMVSGIAHLHARPGSFPRSRCISVLMIFAFMGFSLPSFGMSCVPEVKDCPERLSRLMGALALSRLTILKAQCPKLYPENASAYEVGFDRFSQIIKKKLPDIVEIQATRECRAALENDEKEVAALSRDKLQAECVFLLRDIEKLNSLESR